VNATACGPAETSAVPAPAQVTPGTPPLRRKNIELRPREHLTEAESGC
jgi:hypothetical protein